MLASISAEGVYAILTDYANLENVFSNVKSSNTVETDGEKQLHQVINWFYPKFSTKYGKLEYFGISLHGALYDKLLDKIQSGIFSPWRLETNLYTV